MDHVLVSEDGKVKLSIADAMLARNTMALTDAQALGHLMRQVMDRDSGIQPSQTLELRQPESWSAVAQEFLYSTQDKFCSELLLVSEIGKCIRRFLNHFSHDLSKELPGLVI